MSAGYLRTLFGLAAITIAAVSACTSAPRWSSRTESVYASVGPAIDKGRSSSVPLEQPSTFRLGTSTNTLSVGATSISYNGRTRRLVSQVHGVASARQQDGGTLVMLHLVSTTSKAVVLKFSAEGRLDWTKSLGGVVWCSVRPKKIVSRTHGWVLVEASRGCAAPLRKAGWHVIELGPNGAITRQHHVEVAGQLSKLRLTKVASGLVLQGHFDFTYPRGCTRKEAAGWWAEQRLKHETCTATVTERGQFSGTIPGT